MPKSNNIYCACCGKLKEPNMFTISLNPYHGKYLPICKSCVKNKIKLYKEKTKSMGAALWCLCAEVNYPMVQEIYNVIRQKVDDKMTLSATDNIFILYHNALKSSNVIAEGFWQSDMMLDDFIYLGHSRVKVKADENDYDAPAKILTLGQRQQIWGNYAGEDLDLLDSFYENYTQDKDINDYVMELRYRDLCKAELRKRKADESGDSKEIGEAEKSIKNNMSLLNLDKFQSTIKSDEEKRLEYLIYQIEHTKPSECEDLNKYKDFSGFGKVYDDIMRCIRNLIAGTRDYPEVPKDKV